MPGKREADKRVERAFGLRLSIAEPAATEDKGEEEPS